MAKADTYDSKQQLAKLIINCSYKYRSYELLRWLLGATLVDMGYKQDSYYLYPPEAREDMMKIIRCYVEAVSTNEPFTDILGPVYMELASHGSKQQLGQFFTPQPVAYMMAQMQMPEIGPNPAGGLWTVQDPACGSGVMLLSFAQSILKDQGPDALLNYGFFGVDLDMTCAKMCATQFVANMLLHDLLIGEVEVLRGDSLRQDGFTTMYHMRLPVRKAAPSVPQLPPKPVEMPKDQMELFV